jgi:hypothetical protein
MLQIIPPHASVRDLFAFAICATGVGWGAQALGSGLPLKFLHDHHGAETLGHHLQRALLQRFHLATVFTGDRQ